LSFSFLVNILKIQILPRYALAETIKAVSGTRTTKRTPIISASNINHSRPVLRLHSDACEFVHAYSVPSAPSLLHDEPIRPQYPLGQTDRQNNSYQGA